MLSQSNNSPVISLVGDGILLKKVILKAKEGDKEAFATLYTSLYTPLYRYVLSRCKDKDLTDDVCQQTFLKFYVALSSYEPEKSPLAYLFTIAKRLLINHGEKKTFEPFDDSLLETYKDDSHSILDEAHLEHLSQEINSFLPHLTDDEQEVIRLYFFSELSYKEISDVLEKEEAYLRKIKERALKKLRILTQHLHE
ncbi:MAG: sigma-70 family RNA polymerase sigma factor [Candidatus Pacebacteria bacterium]|nr:sigma-70 family RNA polymerase sigma factor [Candidatus Paceibacterota bacterium]